jgi:hypothetical protein
MARKTKIYTVPDAGRDQGKSFLITEMSAARAESWAMRALLALIKNGAQVPDGFERAGMAGIAQVGLAGLSGLEYKDAQPLLAEMMSCVAIQCDPSRPNFTRALIEDDIEEIQTLVKLKAEVWAIHTDFLKAAVS